MNRPPLAACLLGGAFCLWAVLSVLLAFASEPQIPKDSYALFYPSDGLKSLRGLIVTSGTFISGVLFLAAQSSASDRRGAMTLLSIVPYLATVELARTSIEAMIPLAVSLAVEVIFYRSGLLPAWWLTLRIPMVVVVAGGVWLALPVTWP